MGSTASMFGGSPPRDHGYSSSPHPTDEQSHTMSSVSSCNEMGAASMLFIDSGLEEASKQMLSNERIRYDFVDFVKSGLWISKLYHYEAGGKGSVKCNPPTAADLKISPQEAAILEAFFGRMRLDTGASTAVLEGATSPKSNRSGSEVGIGSLTPTKEQWQLVHAEDYEVDLTCDTKQCFPVKMLMPVLFNVIYPIYVESKTSYDFTSASPQSSSDSAYTPSANAAAALVAATARGVTISNPIGSLSISPISSPRMHKTQHSRLAQKLLTAIAAYFDEMAMLEALQQRDWLNNVVAAVENCSIAISVCDARSSGFPILYVNSAMTRITRFKKSDFIGKSFKCLQGPETSKKQLGVLSAALKNAKPLKLALTNYTKNGRKFLNMLTIKPVFDSRKRYTYVVGIHLDANCRLRSKVEDEVRIVNDLAALLPHMLKFPKVDETVEEESAANAAVSDSGKFAPRASFALSAKILSNQDVLRDATVDAKNEQQQEFPTMRKSLSDLGMVALSGDGNRVLTLGSGSNDSGSVSGNAIIHSTGHHSDSDDRSTGGANRQVNSQLLARQALVCDSMDLMQ